jgi:antitoxin MazE9
MSLPAEDVEFLDAYAKSLGYQSRSAALHAAVRLLRSTELSSAYQDAWQEWELNDEKGAWDTATADGIGS